MIFSEITFLRLYKLIIIWGMGGRNNIGGDIMKFSIEKVLERDIDLYIINKLINDSNFKNLFFDKINCQNYRVSECKHSYSDEDGESDIVVILENNKKKIGLLIENKINAIAMLEQYKRYKKRAEKYIKLGKFDDYHIFIIAPKDYLQSNSEAKLYDNKISYEEIISNIKGDLFGETLIKKAIEEKKKGYSVIEDKNVTAFWNKYYDFVEKDYHKLSINRRDGARGSRALWPIFLTPIKNVQIIHKADKGYVDLTFPGIADYYFEVEEIIKEVLNENITLHKTGKSLAIRKIVPKVNFSGDFEEQKGDLAKCLDSVLELQGVIGKINYKEILKLRKDN